MDIEALKEKMREFFRNNFRTLIYEGGYCTKCAFSEDVEAIDEFTFNAMLDEIDEWSKEQFGDKNGQ